MSEQITVVAAFCVKPEAVNSFEQAAVKVVAATRLEDGCLNYDLHRDLTDQTKYLMHENWTSAAALENHFKTAHIREFQSAVKELLSAPIEIRRFVLINPKQ